MSQRAAWVAPLFVVFAGIGILHAACGSEDDGSGAGPGGTSGGTSGMLGSSGDVNATSITIDPPMSTLDVTGKVTKTVQLVVHAQPSNTVVKPDSWTLDNPVLGSIDANGLFTTSNKAAGVVNVTASYKGRTAQAVITIKLATSFTSGNAPGNAPSLFDPTGKTVVTADPKVPSLVYPVNDTAFPQNVYRVLHQWNGQAMPLFQLEFTSALLKASVYTDGAHATCAAAQTGGSCWESDETSWTALAASNAGQAVTLKIRSIDPAAPTTIYESKPYTFHFSKKDVPGAIYYWSTTVAGVRRGAMGDKAPSNFLTPGEAAGKCVACHTVSKNGKLLAADIGGENLGVVQVTPAVPPPVNFGSIGTPPTNYSSSWATFDPQAKLVVQSRAGVMTMRDSTTGATVGANNGLVPLAGVKGIQPDWAFDGAHIVFGGGGMVKDRGGASTVQWISTTIAGGAVTYGAPEVLLAAQAGKLYGYPMFNPTNDYVSFVQGPKIERDLLDQLFLVKAKAGETPVNLTRANTLVNDGTAPATGIENNMATWAPTTGPDLQWIAFASKRDYGFVLRDGSKIGSDMQQIWIAAIDVSKLGTGMDPSFPAFRVPFMELTENCHRPFWALDALKPGGGGDAGTGDAGYDAGPCHDLGEDCATGLCCNGLECIDDGASSFTCRLPVN